MALKFNCPGCNSEIVVKYLKIGERAKCWSCGAEAVVPGNAEQGSFPETAQGIAGPWRAEERMPVVEPEKHLVQGSFNWGAFFLTPLWLLCHGRVGTGILLILLGIGFRVIIASAAGAYLLALIIQVLVMVYFGAEGNRIAAQYKGYTSLGEVKAKEKGWTIAGLIVGFVFVVPLNIIGLGIFWLALR